MAMCAKGGEIGVESELNVLIEIVFGEMKVDVRQPCLWWKCGFDFGVAFEDVVGLKAFVQCP